MCHTKIIFVAHVAYATELFYVEHVQIYNRISPVASAAYHDLLRSLREDAATPRRGKPFRVERNGKAYWYEGYRLGSDIVKTYIGEDTPELRAILSQAASGAEQRQNGERHRARLIRLLRAEGFLNVHQGAASLLFALAKIGAFRLGGTIVGTQAFRLYEGELGISYGFDQTAQTNDIDIASFERLSLALNDEVTEPLEKILAGFAFAPVPSLEKNKVWRWRQTRNELLVEFLTPSFDGSESLKPLAALGVYAQSLHYLNFLIADPIWAAIPYRYGVLVQIPRPERFAIHKLIVANRRREDDAIKARKDREQAALLIAVLAEDRPADLAAAYEDAAARGPRWRERMAATLKLLPAAMEQLRECGANAVC